MTPLIWPMLAQIGWTFLLYAWLTFARQRAVARGEVDYGCFQFGREEPVGIARITRNLSNQFELPVIFYAIVVLLIATNRVTTFDIVAAWIFVFGRIVHTGVQTLTDNVPLRGQVFMVNFMALAAMIGNVAWRAIQAL